MNTKKLCGQRVAKHYYNIIRSETDVLKKHNIKPGLAVIQIGNDVASKLYVDKKIQACEKYNFKSILKQLPETTTEQEIKKHINNLNDDGSIHGILVQLPLPKHINKFSVINAININKDVDGFHPINIGKFIADDNPLFKSCTPLGCLKLLDFYNYNVTGKNVVVIGNSNVVGNPLSQMLLKRGATVTICHKFTENISQYTTKADFIFTACGVPYLLKRHMINANAIIIDIGINQIQDNGVNRIVGDVDSKSVSGFARALTPVPGGIGPMTISMLLLNTLLSAKRFAKIA